MYNFDAKRLTQPSAPIFMLGLVIGLFLSFSVFNGDSAGRVNLLYLLFVYLCIPVISIICSVVCVLFGKPMNIAVLARYLPLWSLEQKQYLSKLYQLNKHKTWLVYQSQWAALGFSLASMGTLLVLLLITDVNFVWRSTLLSPQQLQTGLQLVAMPWWFWDAAQPKLILIQQTQDSRLTEQYIDNINYGSWWAFVFATQLVYAFFLRSVMLLVSRVYLLRGTLEHNTLDITPTLNTDKKLTRTADYTTYITTSMPNTILLANWAHFPEHIIQELGVSSLTRVDATPSSTASNMRAHQYPDNLLVLVKAWEPPMGELADFLSENHGLIYPINIEGTLPNTPLKKHRQEWLRFTSKYPRWRMYQPETWTTHYDE